MDHIIEMKAISKSFGDIKANSNIDFQLRRGEIHAIVGENGAGKSTLMKILYGQYTADRGTIFINGKKERYDVGRALKLGIGMVHQNFMQIERMSIVDNIILGHAPKKRGLIDYSQAKQDVMKLLESFSMKDSPDTLIKNLGVGERQRIEIIKVLYLGANILILDEPTAVLTPQETKELFSITKALKEEGKSIIFISHKLREVVEIADRVTVMRRGEVVKRFGKDEIQENEIAKAMIGSQDFSLLQNKDRGSNREKILEVKDLWVLNEEGAAKLKELNFHVKAGEILGVGGVEGNGQTELINSIIGMKPNSSGKIYLNGKEITANTIRERRDLGLGYISEDRMTTGLALDADMEENVICGKEDLPQFSKMLFMKKKSIESYAQDLEAEFDIRGISKDKPVKQLSGGNMQKIVLAREISRQPSFLLAAQPTRGLDIGAINFVRQQLLEQKSQGTAVLLVSADLEELMSLSDRMIILYEGEISGEVVPREFTDNHITEEEIGLMMGGVKRQERQAG